MSKWWTCKIGIHFWAMPANFLATIEDGMKKLWVVRVCNGCKTIQRIGLADEQEASPDTKPTKIPDGYVLK